jgi:hypothetical protein
MLGNVQRTNTGLAEFFLKFSIVLLVIMPACILGSFWIGWQLDKLLNIDFLKLIAPIGGSLVGLLFTALLILAGHAKDRAAAAKDICDVPAASAATQRNGPEYAAAFRDR